VCTHTRPSPPVALACLRKVVPCLFPVNEVHVCGYAESQIGCTHLHRRLVSVVHRLHSNNRQLIDRAQQMAGVHSHSIITDMQCSRNSFWKRRCRAQRLMATVGNVRTQKQDKKIPWSREEEERDEVLSLATTSRRSHFAGATARRRRPPAGALQPTFHTVHAPTTLGNFQCHILLTLLPNE
jgi:hypothetical protein